MLRPKKIKYKDQKVKLKIEIKIEKIIKRKSRNRNE